MKKTLLVLVLIVSIILSACNDDEVSKSKSESSHENENQCYSEKYGGFTLPDDVEMMQIKHDGLKEDIDPEEFLDVIHNGSIEDIAELSHIPINLPLLPYEGENPWEGSWINEHDTSLAYSTYVYFEEAILPIYIDYTIAVVPDDYSEEIVPENAFNFKEEDIFQMTLNNCQKVNGIIDMNDGDDGGENDVIGAQGFIENEDNFTYIGIRLGSDDYHKFNKTEMKHLLKLIFNSTIHSK